MSGGFGQKYSRNVKIERKVARRAPLCAKVRVQALCVKLSSPLRLCRCEKSRQEERSHKKCILHVCAQLPLAGGFPPIWAHVLVSSTITYLYYTSLCIPNLKS